MIDRRVLVFSIVLALGLSACQLVGSSPRDGVPGGPLRGSGWELVRIELPNGVVDATTLREPATLFFDAARPTAAGGRGGCNLWGADYTADAATGTVRFTNLVSTLMACTPETGRVEQPYFAALQGAERYDRQGEHLRIATDRSVAASDTVLVFAPREMPEALPRVE